MNYRFSFMFPMKNVAHKGLKISIYFASQPIRFVQKHRFLHWNPAPLEPMLIHPTRGKTICIGFNTLWPRQDGRHFPDDNFICIFENENISISIKISLKFVTRGPNNNIPALVQIMAWRRLGDKPLSEPMMVSNSLLTHICVTWPQWVNLMVK